MRDVIRKLVDAESEARRMVDAARVEADRIAADARHAAEELAARSRRDARREAEEVVETATREALRIKRERLAHASAAIEAEVGVDSAVRQGLIDAAVRHVCGQSGGE